MKLRDRTNNVISGGNIGEETSFKIAMNGKMFRTLSDSLYEDKIGSIVREISCNGVDAHVMAGTPKKPITIHVPNTIEPWFSVKDEGVGLSDEDVRTVITSYGGTTKDQSNDVIGAYGLGAKTPFAYTDQFTIISIHGGMKRTYIAVIGNENIPSLSMQHEEETDEHPGLEVTIAVENKDFNQFADKIIEQLKFFPVKPHLTNNMRNLKFPVLDDPKTIMFQDDKFVLGNKDFPINRVYIKQGGVAYPLNLYHFEDINIHGDFNQFLYSLESYGCVLDFAIGDIDVTASREGISYEPTTVENIKNRLFYVRDTITKEALNEIKSIKHTFNRIAYLNSLPHVLKEGIIASDDVKTLLGDITNHFNSVTFDIQDFARKYTVKSLEYGLDGRIARNVLSGSSGVNVRYFTPKENTVIYINDGVTNYIKRVKHHHEGKSLKDYGNILIVNSDIKKSAMTATAVKEIRNDVLKHFKIDPKDVVNISSLPELPKAEKKARTYGALPTHYLYKRGYAKFDSSDWDAEYDDLDDLEDTIYIGMHRHVLEPCNEDVKMVVRAVEAGVIDKQLVAVNQRTYNRIKEGKIGDNLLSVEDVITEIKDECERVKPFIRAISRYNGFLRGMDDYSSVRKFVVKGIVDREDYPEYFRAKEIIKKRRDMLNARVGKYDGIVHIDDAFRIQDEGVEDGKKLVNRFFEKYPMLQYHVVPCVFSEDDEKNLKEYVKMVNEVKGA